jgi:hypothetical protein
LLIPKPLLLACEEKGLTIGVLLHPLLNSSKMADHHKEKEEEKKSQTHE